MTAFSNMWGKKRPTHIGSLGRNASKCNQVQWGDIKHSTQAYAMGFFFLSLKLMNNQFADALHSFCLNCFNDP